MRAAARSGDTEFWTSAAGGWTSAAEASRVVPVAAGAGYERHSSAPRRCEDMTAKAVSHQCLFMIYRGLNLSNRVPDF